MRRLLTLCAWLIAFPALAQVPVNPIWNPIVNPNTLADQTVQQLGAPTLYTDFAHGFYEGCPTPTTCWTSSGPTGYAAIPGWTFTRASQGYAQNSGGTFVSFASGVPRVTDLGLLVEGASTNGIRNNSSTGAVVGTPGTLPTNWTTSNNTGVVPAVNALGTDGGLPYVDLSFVGSVGAVQQTNVFMEGQSQIAAAQGQTWTASIYLKLPSGTIPAGTTPNLVIQENNSSGTAVAAGLSPCSPAGSSGNLGVYQCSYTRTLSAATTAFIVPYVQMNATSAATWSFVLRMGAPQLEQQSFASSPILTTSAAVTRAADVAYVTGLSLSAGFSAYGKFTGPPTGSFNSNNSRIMALSPNGNGYPYEVAEVIKCCLGNPELEYGSNVRLIGSGSVTAGVQAQFAIIAFPGNWAAAFNGSVGGFGTSSYGSLPSPINWLTIGSSATSQYLNSQIQSIGVWPTAASSTQLQNLTAGGSQ